MTKKINIIADLIAAGLSPFAPEQTAIKAGRLMLQQMDECGCKGAWADFDNMGEEPILLQWGENQ
jgi:predicted ABC-type ATPase